MAPLNNPFANIRLGRIFNPTNPIGGGRPEPFDEKVRDRSGNVIFDPMHPTAQPAPQQDMINDTLSSVYTPEHNYSDLYLKTLGEMPQREKPGWMRKIGAGLYALSGDVPGVEKYLDEPYQEKLTDWATRMKSIEPGLTAERYGNVNERMLANEIIGRRIQERRADIAQGESERKATADQERAANQRIRTNAYVFKQMHPNHEIGEDKEGYLIGIDRTNNDLQYITDDDGNKVKGSKLPDADKINLQVKGRLTEIGAQAAEQRKTEAVKGEEARKTEAVKQKGRIEIKDNKDASGKVTSRTTTVYDADGNVTGSRTDKISVAPVKPGPGGKVAVPDNVPKIKMTTPDGRLIMVPQDKVAEAEQRGAKRAK